jgi:hypothetical protein
MDGDLYNTIAENLERLDKWAVQPPMNLQQTPAGNLLSVNLPNSKELALVRILGTETGGGRYKGSIMAGNSSGSLTTNFQLEPTSYQSGTDGPVFTPTTGSPTVPLNNALVINVMEQYVTDSHLLYSSAANNMYTIGRVMGKTTESSPRTIVYVESWPIKPVIAKITVATPGSLGGTYYGRIVRGLFGGPGNVEGFTLPVTANPSVGSTDNCWINNQWEQLYLSTSGAAQIPVGTYVPGFVAGMPFLNSTANGCFHMVYTWFPLQMPTISGGVPGLATVQTAGTSYTPTEQAMLNNLKSDVTNLQAVLQTLYSNLKGAGYSL